MTDDGIPDWIRDHYDGDVPSIGEDPSGPIQFDGLSLGTDAVTTSGTAMQDYADDAAREFAEYVIGEAGERIPAGALTVEVVRDAIHILERNGFDMRDGGLGFSHPEQFGGLRDAWDSMSRAVLEGEHDPINSMKKFGIDGVDVHEDRSMPEDTGVVMHSDAAMPRNPEHALGPPRGLLDAALSPRPWLVAHPEGVVVIDTSGGDA